MPIKNENLEGISCICLFQETLNQLYQHNIHELYTVFNLSPSFGPKLAAQTLLGKET